MVYLRPCTSVFYIIQVTAVRIQVSAASAVMRVSSNLASASSMLIVSHVTLRSKAQVATPLLLDFRYLL